MAGSFASQPSQILCYRVWRSGHGDQQCADALCGTDRVVGTFAIAGVYDIRGPVSAKFVPERIGSMEIVDNALAVGMTRV
jgi:hypothetical protein